MDIPNCTMSTRNTTPRPFYVLLIWNWVAVGLHLLANQPGLRWTFSAMWGSWTNKKTLHIFSSHLDCEICCPLGFGSSTKSTHERLTNTGWPCCTFAVIGEIIICSSVQFYEHHHSVWRWKGQISHTVRIEHNRFPSFGGVVACLLALLVEMWCHTIDWGGGWPYLVRGSVRPLWFKTREASKLGGRYFEWTFGCRSIRERKIALRIGRKLMWGGWRGLNRLATRLGQALHLWGAFVEKIFFCSVGVKNQLELNFS